MHRYFVALYLLFSILQPHTGLAAGVYGRITDAVSGRALSGAGVALAAEPGGTTTAAVVADGKGKFRLDVEDPGGAGRYRLTVTCTGYERKVITGISLIGSGNTRLEIALLPLVIDLNPVVITPSRRAEKALEAPAQVIVIPRSEIAGREALTPTEYLAGKPSVDMSQTGLNHEEVVLRGFNGIYNGQVMMLIDDRDTRLPNFRINVLYHMPTTDADLESIEAVSGPAAALYGANSAYGVINYRTRSPFESQGGSISLAGGERGVIDGTFRQAGLIGDKLGYKVSLRHFQGRDWKSSDPAEPDSIRLMLPTASGTVPVSGVIANRRDFDLRNSSFDARLDYRPAPDLTAVFSGGLTRSDFFNITNQGALQADGFIYSYLQARLKWRSVFAQAYVNSNTSNDDSYGYFLRNGLVVVDKSKVYALQLQQSISLSGQALTWGADAHFTRPETRHTFHGRNEDNDGINETGLYLQDRISLNERLELVAAGRVDKHNRLEKVQFSPRAALTFSPTEKHHLRLTFNQAFTAPNTPRLFWDFKAGDVANPFAPLNPAFENDLVTLRVSGTPLSGYHFPRDSRGLPLMDSQFDNTEGYSEATLNSVWPTLRTILAARNPQLAQLLPETLGAVVPGVYRDLFNDRVMDNVADIERLKPERTSSLELGLKSLLGERLLLTVSGWYTRIEDFMTFTYTPAVFADPQALAAVLASDIAARLVASGMPPDMAQAQAAAVAAQVTPTVAALPIGVVSPLEAPSATDLYRTNRNFGSISFFGADLGLDYRIDRNWAVEAAYSFVSKDLFRNVDGIQDIPLNAPKHKLGLGARYLASGGGWHAGLRLRRVNGFPSEDGVYSGYVESFSVLDFNSGCKLPFNRNLELTLTVKNLLNDHHREFAGAPELGRLAILRMTCRY